MPSDIKTIRARVADWLTTHPLTHDIGDTEAACSIAALNIAIDGRLTDDRPACVCPALHAWIVLVQDALPTTRGPYDLNGPRWQAALPLVVGTDDGRAMDRAEIVIDWLWTVVLPFGQSVADRAGCGEQWAAMCRDQTLDAVTAACNALDQTLRVHDWPFRFDPDVQAISFIRDAAELALDNMRRRAYRTAETLAEHAAYSAHLVIHAVAPCEDFFAAIDAPGVLERLVHLPPRAAT